MTPREKAERFLRDERAFRLGTLMTESSHEKTRTLSQAADADMAGAVRMLQSVDRDLPPVIADVLAGEPFRRLVGALSRAMSGGRRIFFTGCGATGRLSILLETAWRRFWREQKHIFKAKGGKVPAAVADAVVSVMAGGDFALIKSVEGFEDFPDFGRYQLLEAGVGAGDVVVAITEGGETPFVIGTAWAGLDSEAEVFFVYNNPTEQLRAHVARSREVIEEPRITKLDLATGPMAITGSTRMQATTIELLVVGAALEMALLQYLIRRLGGEQVLAQASLSMFKNRDYHGIFCELLDVLEQERNVMMLAALADLERGLYQAGGLVTYLADDFLLDLLTDTTERSPTFMIPPFRRCDDGLSPLSWAFVKDPRRPTAQAWQAMLERMPRGIDWPAGVYQTLNAPAALQAHPPDLSNDEIFKFQIGKEPDPTRLSPSGSAEVHVQLGNSLSIQSAGDDFSIQCRLPDSPLKLWHRLALKLVFNTVSTATMAGMDRVIGNAMVWLSPSNKKLVDRGTRLIAQVTGVDYRTACIALHEAMDEVARRQARHEAAPSPVALAIERLGLR